MESWNIVGGGARWSAGACSRFFMGSGESAAYEDEACFVLFCSRRVSEFSISECNYSEVAAVPLE